MIRQGKRNLAELKARVREALLSGNQTAGIRQEIAEIRGRVAGWESAIKEIGAQDARVIADTIAALRTRIALDTVGAISDRLATLQSPPHPTVQGEQI